MSAESLAEELWSDRLPKNWEAALRNAVVEARQALGPEAIQTIDGRYALALEDAQVDAWLLELEASKPAPSVEAIDLLKHFRPFDGLEPTPAIRRMSMALNIARLELLERLCPGGFHVHPSLLADLAEQVRLDPFDAPLSEAVLRVMLRFGRHPEALELIDELEKELDREIGAELSSNLTALRTEARLGLRSSRLSPPVARTRLPFPQPLAAIADTPATCGAETRARDLARRLGKTTPSTLLVTGRSGVGKSRLVASVSSELYGRGAHIAFGCGIQGASVPYAPLFAALDTFRRDVSDRASETSAWVGFVEAVETVEPDRPLWLVIDDAHVVDPATFRLLQFAQNSNLQRHVGLILVGRDEGGSGAWLDYVRGARFLPRTNSVVVDPLEQNEVEEIVRRRWPLASSHTVKQAAADVARASGGLPLRANFLTDRLVGESLRLVGLDHLDGGDAIASTLRRLPSASRRAVEAAAVLADEFSDSEVAGLLGWSRVASADALDDLVAAGVLTDSELPEVYGFAHGLLREAAKSLTPRRRWRALHRMLMETTESDIERARHALASVPLVSADEACRLALAGAESALGAGLSRQTVELLEAAESHLGHLRVEHEILRALGLARLGAVEASRQARRRVADLAIRSGDPTEGVRAVLLCLPHLEQLDTLEGVLEELLVFDLELVSEEVRFSASVARARLMALAGLVEPAENSVLDAQRFARTPDEEASLLIAEWFVRSPLGAERDWSQRVAKVSAAGPSLGVLTKLVQIEAIEHARSGSFDAAETSSSRMRELAVACDDSLRHWHSLLFQAMLHQFRGEWTEARQASKASARVGYVLDIAAASSAKAAQEFFELLVTGGLESWLASIESASSDVAGSNLAVAAIARALYETGRLDEAEKLGKSMLADSLRRPNMDTLPAVWLLAPILVSSPGLREMRGECLSAARTQAGRWLLAGSGFVVHGPVDQLVALLDGDEKVLLDIREQLPDKGPWRDLLDRDLSLVNPAIAP